LTSRTAARDSDGEHAPVNAVSRAVQLFSRKKMIISGTRWEPCLHAECLDGSGSDGLLRCDDFAKENSRKCDELSKKRGFMVATLIERSSVTNTKQNTIFFPFWD
jgi:hypothetical protein